MSSLQLRLSRAVERGRSEYVPPRTRQDILVTLLNKRAVASRMGATELEAQLREQIRWTLPVFERVDFSEPKAEAA